MDLYHFTGVPMLHGILTSQSINRGYVSLADGKILHGYPWFTSSPLPYEYGLCDGSEVVTDKDLEFLKRASPFLTESPARKLNNKQLIRIKVDGEWLKKQEGFIRLLNS
ncbi:hypothetical protein [Candidatus Erwinia dacicola]|uniref:hypothetical protein n=1 Tax=Candidatus Erwinia dacicola TaxID=252393 RepID=UPI0011D06999|nr:hypothetical protein [Candidatus Erwinia dacicola]